MTLGVTGLIGSGKSTAARMLAAMGGRVVDADLIGRQVVDQDERLRTRLARRFGDHILTPSGRLRRRVLADIVFGSDAMKAALNRIVHPPLLKELRKQVRSLERTVPVVIVDAALIPNWGMCNSLDSILLVHASRADRLARLEARGMSRADARARQRSQLPYSAYRDCADRIILNNSTPDHLQGKLRAFYRSLIRELG